MIRLLDGYAIQVDSYNYTLGVAKTTTVVDKKSGNEVEKEILVDCKYFPDLDKTLLGYWKLMRKKKLANFEGSLQDALEVLKKQDERIKKLISKVKEDYK